MNAALPEHVQRPAADPSAPPLHLLALALLAPDPSSPPEGIEGGWLQALAAQAGPGDLQAWFRHPPPPDRRLRDLAAELRLGPLEMVAVALAWAAEFDPTVSRMLAWLQAPLGASRPTVGLVQAIGDRLGLAGGLATLLGGPALASGLLQLEAGSRPLHEQALLIPVPLALQLHGHRPGAAAGDAVAGAAWGWPALRVLAVDPAAMPPSLLQAAKQQAGALQAAATAAVLVLRSGHPREALAAAALLATALGRQAVAWEGDAPPGLGPWLWLRGAVPVWQVGLGPGDSLRVPALPGYRGPRLVATGPDGNVHSDGDPWPAWTVPLPGPDERTRLWQRHLPPEAARRLGQAHRHGTAHIEHLARSARHQALLAGDGGLQAHHVDQAARGGAVGELGTLAQRVADDVGDDALVLPPGLREQLQALQQRCRLREGLARGLGPSTRTRWRCGVRALLVGPSGTGKTLAAAWLATALGLPLYRVDLAAVASKYIGETEKNLAQLFARAEHAEVVLLFDEADSLFGKRTDVKDANDRFANQQTNYLLQRIESFEGIALLTSNSRTRFDGAFTRRLDMIIDFPAPGPEERKALWRAHLGPAHRLTEGDLNRVAALCELAGGHIRNVVLAAAALAQGPEIDGGALLHALSAEYGKLGKSLPNGLKGN